MTNRCHIACLDTISTNIGVGYIDDGDDDDDDEKDWKKSKSRVGPVWPPCCGPTYGGGRQSVTGGALLCTP